MQCLLKIYCLHFLLMVEKLFFLSFYQNRYQNSFVRSSTGTLVSLLFLLKCIFTNVWQMSHFMHNIRFLHNDFLCSFFPIQTTNGTTRFTVERHKAGRLGQGLCQNVERSNSRYCWEMDVRSRFWIFAPNIVAWNWHIMWL